MSARDATLQLLERKPRIFWGRVVQAFLRAGWNPPTPDERVVASITEAIRDIERGVFRPAEQAILSPRQSQVLACAASGLTVPETAAKLCLAHQTVLLHRGDAREKLGARTTAHAVALALEQGLLVLDV